MADRQLRLLAGASPLGANDDWTDGGQHAVIAATGRAPPYVAEAALLATLDPGAHTVQILGRAKRAGRPSSAIRDV